MFRLGYNEYLKELGIKPDDYPFDRDKKNRYKKETGFNDYLTWSLSWNLIIFTYCYIRRMYDVSKNTVDWDKHKQQGDFDFELALKGLRTYIVTDENKITPEDIKEFQESWNYIGEHMNYIWW